MSDDNAMMNQIHATHAHDGREINVRPLFQLVEDILNLSTPGVDSIVTVSTRIRGLKRIVPENIEKIILINLKLFF